jgi:hypothetical protein
MQHLLARGHIVCLWVSVPVRLTPHVQHDGARQQHEGCGSLAGSIGGHEDHDYNQKNLTHDVHDLPEEKKRRQIRRDDIDMRKRYGTQRVCRYLHISIAVSLSHVVSPEPLRLAVSFE